MEANLEKLVTELSDLDPQLIYVDGKMVKPSQCFRYETDPLHFMFNTNCPDELKKQVEEIFKKHAPSPDNNVSRSNSL
ncbi:MAG TPA: hypothetical protein VGO58_20210 [Chitinophagaceae bacterium]|jgi:hypothetical protein|nr:hypothetical protein [Chitinophagaceae bacterium]